MIEILLSLLWRDICGFIARIKLHHFRKRITNLPNVILDDMLMSNYFQLCTKSYQTKGRVKQTSNWYVKRCYLCFADLTLPVIVMENVVVCNECFDGITKFGKWWMAVFDMLTTNVGKDVRGYLCKSLRKLLAQKPHPKAIRCNAKYISERCSLLTLDELVFYMKKRGIKMPNVLTKTECLEAIRKYYLITYPRGEDVINKAKYKIHPSPRVMR